MTAFRALGASFALMLAASLPGLAQTTTTADTTQTAPAPAPGGDVSLGTPAAAPGGGLPTQDAAKVGQTYFLQNFDSWEERCKKTADGSDPCLLYQLLKDSTGNPVSEITIFALPDGQQAVTGATVVAPLETLLTKQLGLAIDGATPKIYPFAFCTKDGCISRVGFTADELAALKKGTKATVTIVPAAAPDKTVVLDISLKGFTAGYTAVEATRPKK
jgi:invasion protein IalB